MATADAAARSAALGGPRPNPSGDGARPNPSGDGPRIQSPPGKRKPIALADITNTGRRDATRSLSVGDVVKENAKLIQLLSEKTKIIDVSRVEMQKLHLALQSSRQQNQQLAQANSQMLAELNLGKDRLKELQHELSCTVALLKAKDSELKKKNKAANQRQNEMNSQDVRKVIPSNFQAVDGHRIDGLITIATEHHLADSSSVQPSTTACQEPPNDVTTKRARNKRKSESSECMKETNVMQEHYRPHLQPVLSLDHEDPRKPARRRSTRLNPGFYEIAEVSCSKLPEDDVVPSAAPSNVSVQKQHEPTTEEDMSESQQNEHNCAITASILKHVQEACSSVPVIEAHEIGGKASTTEQSHLEETQSSLPLHIAEPPKAPKDAGNERVTNQQKLKSGKDSARDHINVKCDSNTSEPFSQDKKRKSQRRKSSRLDLVISENTMSASETQLEDVTAPLPPSSSNASVEPTINEKQTDGSSTKITGGQVVGRRSIRRAAEKVVSYKEIPLNIKMRRP